MWFALISFIDYDTIKDRDVYKCKMLEIYVILLLWNHWDI